MVPGVTGYSTPRVGTWVYWWYFHVSSLYPPYPCTPYLHGYNTRDTTGTRGVYGVGARTYSVRKYTHPYQYPPLPTLQYWGYTWVRGYL